MVVSFSAVVTLVLVNQVQFSCILGESIKLDTSRIAVSQLHACKLSIFSDG
jgi:hypothetical protein